MFDWIRKLFTSGWSGRCPLCGSSRVAIKIRRKMPYVVDGPTFAYLHMPHLPPYVEPSDPHRHLTRFG